MPRDDRKLRKIAAEQSKSIQQSSRTLTLREAILLGVPDRESDAKPYVNLKYYWPNHQCFSEWPKEKLRAFSDFCTKLGEMNWIQIFNSGGSLGKKTGFGYTKHDDPSVLPSHPKLDQISPEINWFELRVDGESRVHGFRAKDAFFLVFLDKDHDVYHS